MTRSAVHDDKSVHFRKFVSLNFAHFFFSLLKWEDKGKKMRGDMKKEKNEKKKLKEKEISSILGGGGKEEWKEEKKFLSRASWIIIM